MKLEMGFIKYLESLLGNDTIEQIEEAAKKR